MILSTVDRSIEKAPAVPFVRHDSASVHPDEVEMDKKGPPKDINIFYATGSSLRAELPRGHRSRVHIRPISSGFAVENRSVFANVSKHLAGISRLEFKLPAKQSRHHYYELAINERWWADDDILTYSQFHKTFGIIDPDASPTILIEKQEKLSEPIQLRHTTPDHLLKMLQQSGRTKTADRIAELISICEEDEDEHYQMDSLKSIARFFLGVPKDKNISDIFLSPDGTFIAEWIGPDGRLLVAMEFLGDNVLLIRKVDGRAKASKVDQLEAQSYLP